MGKFTSEKQAREYFEKLVEDYYDEIYHHVWRIIRFPAKEDIEDVTQDTFKRALEHILSKRDEIKYPRAWLKSIAEHCLSNYLRYKKRCAGMDPKKTAESLIEEKEAPSLEMIASQDNPEAEVMVRERLDVVTEKLKTLPRTQREVADLSRQGYTPKEISQLLNQRPGTTRTYLARGRDALDD